MNLKQQKNSSNNPRGKLNIKKQKTQKTKLKSTQILRKVRTSQDTNKQ